MEDFERCLGLRPGANYAEPRDLWRIRTYGMHFLEDYFPHRELGVARVRLGRPAEAIQLLEQSIRQTASGRAKHYLNRARRAVLRDAPTSKPETKLRGDSRQVWTRDRFRILEGVARGDGFIEEIVVNGQRQFIELAEQEDLPLISSPYSMFVSCGRLYACNLTGLDGNR